MSHTPEYRCGQCGRTLSSQPEAGAPECCGRPMAPVTDDLPFCEVSSTAEHSRFGFDDEPCDDGRGGDG